MQREKFIKLLRNVKTRGESLYLKMAKPVAEQGVCDN